MKNYDKKTKQASIVLVKLKKPFKPNILVNKASIADHNSPLPDRDNYCQIVTWGLVKKTRNIWLRGIKDQIGNINYDCGQKNGILADFCMLWKNGYSLSEVDVGSPLMCYSKVRQKFILNGLNISPPKHLDGRVPRSFISISKYRPWIDSTIKEHSNDKFIDL
ncbi:MAG: Transmembrane protease serine 12 [Paramarteilia canceri]